SLSEAPQGGPPARPPRVGHAAEAAAESGHRREVDDVRQAAGDHEVGLSEVAVLDHDAARLEVDPKRREVLLEAKDDAAAHPRGELRLARDPSLDQPKDAGGDAVLDHPSETDLRALPIEAAHAPDRRSGRPVRLPAVTRAQLTEEILAAKRTRGLSWAELAERLNAPVEWVTAALLGQFPLDETQARAACEALGLDEEAIPELRAE